MITFTDDGQYQEAYAEEHYYLHSVDQNSWRKSIHLVTADHLSTKLWVLRHVTLTQWFIKRASDGVVIAQSKDCKWTL